MKSRPGLAGIIIACGTLILNVVGYWMDPSDLYRVPFTFFFLIIIIGGIFEIGEYYNRTIYPVITAVLLGVMWITYIQIFPKEDESLFYLIGILTLIVIAMLIYTLRTWEKNEKALEYYDDILFGNPNDTITLNNKGVELVNQRKYLKAMECFDKVIEIDPNDAAALYNKSVSLKKSMRHLESIEYRDKAREIDPGFENAKRSGKIILEN